MKLVCPTCSADAAEDRISMHNGMAFEADGTTPKPFIHLAWGTDMRVQLSPAEVRTHALYLLECAEAAEQDACVYTMLRKEIGVSLEQAGHFVSGLRSIREKYKA